MFYYAKIKFFHARFAKGKKSSPCLIGLLFFNCRYYLFLLLNAKKRASAPKIAEIAAGSGTSENVTDSTYFP